MFEDKRFKQNTDNSNNNFFMPDNTGLKEGNDNLNFGEHPTYRKPLKEAKVNKEKKPRNSKSLKILLVVFILGLLVVGGYFIFANFFNNPFSVYKNTLTYGYEYLDNKISDISNKSLDYDKSKDILTSSGTFNINTNLLEELKDYDFKYKIGIDLNKEIIDSNLLINQNNKKVLDFEGFLRDKKVLLNLKDVYDKYLQVSEIASLGNVKDFDIDYDVLKNILKVIYNTLNNNLDKNKIITEKAKIKVQNNTLSVTSNNYKLTAVEVQKLYQNIINNIINDGNIVDSLAEMFNLRKAEIKSSLESFKDNGAILNSLKDLEIKIYTAGITNKVVGGSLLVDNEEIINFTNHKDVININIILGNSTLNIVKNNKDTRLIYYYNDTEIASIIMTKNIDKRTLEFSIEIEKLEIEGSLEIENQRVANKRITTSVLFNAKGKMDKYNFDIELNLDNTIQVGGTIQNIPNNSIVIYDNLSLSERNTIRNKYNELINKLPFKEIFKIKDNTPEPVDYCEVATNCECLGTICTCSYLDTNGIEQKISCLNKNTLTE